MTLAELKALAEKSTPGPWDINPRNSLYPLSVVIETSRLEVARGHCTVDIDYIAASNPETIKQLIARIEGLSEAIEQTVARADDYGDSHLSQPVREALAQFGPDVELK